MLLAQPIFFSPNFPTLIKKTNLRASLQPHNNFPPLRVSQMPKPLGVRARPKTLLAPLQKKSGVQICHSFKKESEVGGNDERDWTTSFLLFLLWAALIYYVFFLTPNQTPVCSSLFFPFWNMLIVIYAVFSNQDWIFVCVLLVICLYQFIWEWKIIVEEI